ncbi:MAG: glycosyltransferase family 2 protein [Snowella sp.]|nr:glycosyltransferase family 2 protein [Snowella sp.]
MELTVLVPIYNRAKMLAQALESLKRQTYQNFVVIVCDDGSQENLKVVVESFPDLKIQYQRYDINVGQFKNVARGLELCQTQFIKILHSDDLLFPMALEKQVEAMKITSDAAICLGGSLEFEKVKNQEMINILNYAKPYVPKLRTSRQWAKLEYYSGYLPSACMYRTDLLRNIGGFNVGLNAIADWEIYVSLSSKYPVTQVDEPICAYRLHSNQMTSKDLFFDKGDLKTKDILWMISNDNPYRERLGLSFSQMNYLRQDLLWQNLLISLKSNQKLFLFKRWIKIAYFNHILLSFIILFPWFVLLKIFRKPNIKRDLKADLTFKKYQDYIYSILFCEQSFLVKLNQK